jgi:hypothetical protein
MSIPRFDDVKSNGEKAPHIDRFEGGGEEDKQIPLLSQKRVFASTDLSARFKGENSKANEKA